MPHTADGIGHRELETSENAAAEVAGKAPFWRLMVMQSLSMDGPATADEIAERLGSNPLTISPRVSELRNEGKIRDTGQRRKNASGKGAAVWQITAEGDRK